MKKLVVLVVLLAGCGYAGDRGYDWFNTQVREPVSPRSQPVGFHVEPGEGTDAIATDLAAKGLIRNPNVFVFYQLDRGATAHDLVKRQLDRFDQQFTPDMRAQAAQATANRPAESVYAIVTLASIVEREVRKDPDRAIVCGILYNRLVSKMALQDDVTVLYGLDKLQGPLTEADKQHDTPYNTYL